MAAKLGEPWTAQEIQTLIDTHSTHDGEEQAALLGRSLSGVRFQRAKLLRQGLIDQSTRKHQRSWTAEEDALIVDMVEDGYSLKTVAKKTGRSLAAVTRRASTLHGGVREIRGSVFAVRTIQQVALLFDVPWREVHDWVRRKWLFARPNGTYKGKSGRQVKLVSDDALQAFMARSEAWMRWDPTRIQDADWRQHAENLRADAGWYWMETADVMFALGFCEESIHRRRRGDVSGPRLPCVRVGGRWYYKSSDVDAYKTWMKEQDRRAA